MQRLFGAFLAILAALAIVGVSAEPTKHQAPYGKMDLLLSADAEGPEIVSFDFHVRLADGDETTFAAPARRIQDGRYAVDFSEHITLEPGENSLLYRAKSATGEVGPTDRSTILVVPPSKPVPKFTLYQLREVRQ